MAAHFQKTAYGHVSCARRTGSRFATATSHDIVVEMEGGNSAVHGKSGTLADAKHQPPISQITQIDSDTLFLYPMIIEALHKLVNHEASLTREEARGVMGEILKGGATDAQVAALAVALHMKGETGEEIVGLPEAIRSPPTPLPLSILSETSTPASGDALVDTCGTGGDVSGTFNISTVTALVVAGAGLRVGKQGNRSATSPRRHAEGHVA